MGVTGDELRKQAGISYRQLDYWTRQGVFAPLERARYGPGYHRPFPESEVPVARAVAQLRVMGAPLDVLREVADQLRVMSEWHGLVFIDRLGLVRREPCGQSWALDLSTVTAAVSVS